MSYKNSLVTLLALPKGLQSMMDLWATYDQELQDHYTHELEWLLMHVTHDFQPEVQDTESASHAYRQVVSMREQLQRCCGIEVPSTPKWYLESPTT